MGTKQVKIQGMAKWAKVFEQNRDKRGYEDAYVECDGAYTIELTMDKDNFMVLADLNAAKASKIKQKEVEKFGEVALKFVRKHKDRFEWSSGAPIVTKADNSLWDVDKDGLIGNDSIVELTVDVYDTSKATGTRLVAVKVLNNVGFEKDATKTPPPSAPKTPTSDEVIF